MAERLPDIGTITGVTVNGTPIEIEPVTVKAGETIRVHHDTGQIVVTTPEQELIAFVRRLAALPICDDDETHASCELDSGPYCAVHGMDIQDAIKEARTLLKNLPA